MIKQKQWNCRLGINGWHEVWVAKCKCGKMVQADKKPHELSIILIDKKWGLLPIKHECGGEINCNDFEHIKVRNNP